MTARSAFRIAMCSLMAAVGACTSLPSSPPGSNGTGGAGARSGPGGGGGSSIASGGAGGQAGAFIVGSGGSTVGGRAGSGAGAEATAGGAGGRLATGGVAMGGSGPSGGSTGVAGTGGAGTGNVGTGGAGTGGAGTGGMGLGGTGTGTGGSGTGGVGTGGIGTGGIGTGGTGGMGTGGTGTGGTQSLISIAKDFDGALIALPCGAAIAGTDCANTDCVNSQSLKTNQYPLGGQPGTVYNLTFRVRGIVEVYAYVGGTRASGTSSISTGDSLFCSGGTQEPSGNGNDYSTYELDVTPAVPGEANIYYLNSVINAENPHVSPLTKRLTFSIDYSATIKVPGGGMVTFQTFDSNCELVQNCGPTPASSCSPRTVSLVDATPQPQATFPQPYQTPAGTFGQWLFFDVTNVTTSP